MNFRIYNHVFISSQTNQDIYTSREEPDLFLIYRDLSNKMSPVKRIAFLTGLFLSFSTSLFAIDEMTQYELLAPDTHQFAIRYDVSATIPGSSVYFNIIRPGSEASLPPSPSLERIS